MNKKLIIIGASGHGKVVADIAESLKIYEKICFLDDAPEKKECMGYLVMGKSCEWQRFLNDSDFAVAIGNAAIRKKISSELLSKKAVLPTLIHPGAYIGRNVQIGAGTVVMAGAIVNADSMIGKGCIINTSSSVDHECLIGDYVHIAVGAHLAGNVKVGNSTWIGAGATVSNNINICENCMIGAGAVVIKDIKNIGTYVGVPAKKKETVPKTAKISGGGITYINSSTISNDFSEMRRVG